MEWLSSVDKRMRKRQEEKAVRELDGCSFKPDLAVARADEPGQKSARGDLSSTSRSRQKSSRAP